jgi:eukaryotic-like serine/threonine-protein kinase
MGSSAEIDPAEQLKVGNYRLVADLGGGGMAEVFLAVDGGLFNQAFSKLVVVKRVRPHLAEDPDYADLLLDEARISALLNHPNVVHVLEVGIEKGQPYLAMEYLDGQPFSRVQTRCAAASQPLPQDVEFTILTDVLRGLHHAHELSDFKGRHLDVVHRDVSPQNIFITYDGHVKLLDFGIAKAAGRMVETKLGFTRGKARYMAPEQATSGAVDRRTDIFSVGVLLWQACLGRRFWEKEIPPSEVLKLLARGSFEPSPSEIADVPAAIDVICRKALAYEREDRYPTAQAMLVDLETYLGDRVVTARRELVERMRTVFEEERAERRAFIERLATSASLAHSVGALAMLASKRSSGRFPVVLDHEADASPAMDEASLSLANVLEPTRSARTTRPPPRGLSLGKRLGLALVAAFAAGLALYVIRATPWRDAGAGERKPNLAEDAPTGASFRSDGLGRAARPPAPSAPAKPDRRAPRPRR